MKRVPALVPTAALVTGCYWLLRRTVDALCFLGDSLIFNTVELVSGQPVVR